MLPTLPVLNLQDAKFECIYGRGCDGICCQNGRPSVSAPERGRIKKNLAKFLPHLRPAARALIERVGFLSRRRKLGEPMLRVQDGWCVFFNEGCVLHKVGAEEGDKYRYKPEQCALFPLTQDEKDRWYVRQRGFKGEAWDLFCLAPDASPMPASESLREEISLAQRLGG
jgi:Fe-S-cluster containining protein